MEELIFFGILILFSILESIARTRKAKQGGELPAPPEGAERESESRGRSWERERAPEAWEPEPADVASYDAEPSDDQRTSSETMIPEDVWREIEALATGRPREPEPEPPPPPPEIRERPVLVRPLPEPPLVRPLPGPPLSRPLESTEVHFIHRSHAGYGTDPSDRFAGAFDDMAAPSREVSADVRAARGMLASGSVGTLRQAFILQEVLGPPASMREG